MTKLDKTDFRDKQRTDGPPKVGTGDHRRDGEGMTEFTLRKIRNEVINECAKAVPTNWCDALLTGPGTGGNLPGRETEALLRGIQDRIHGLKR